ncbi:MAG: stage III sporulation protein AF [Christensenellaceae bacterium]|jgi:stage III sporulation protein AF|nr:stage III sporulation protein AF [Christensenellaceae bacterium]
MSGWLIAVTSTVLATTLVDILLPDGEIKKYVKGITSLIVIVAIISPLLTVKNVLNGGVDELFSVDSALDTLETNQINNYYLMSTNERKKKNLEDKVIKALSTIGIDGAIVVLTGQGLTVTMNIVAVTIDLSKASINCDDTNINIISVVKEIVAQVLAVDDQIITVVHAT